MSSPVYVNPNELLTTKVQDYIPNTYSGYWWMHRHRPIFTQFTIREMLIDPRVIFGLWLIKGPMLSKAKFTVESDTEEVKDFVVEMINEFWLNGAVQALKAIEWGYSGSETLYKQDEKTGRITYCGLKDFESPSVKIVTKNGQRVGIIVDNFQTVRMEPGKAVYLGGPKAFHHVHWRHLHPYYGRSRLVGAHIPWNEIWSEGGYRDIRRLWFYKNAFEGGTMYHPMGYAKTPEGRLIHYQDIAQNLIEKKRTGATMTLPSDTDARGNRKWEYTEARGNTIPAGLFDYGESLRIEILEAMGIPYEVIEASGNEGFGSSSGREIPETAFYAILQEELNWLIHDFVNQIARPMVQVNASLGLLPYDTFGVLAHPLESNPMEMEYDETKQQPQTDAEGNEVEGPSPEEQEAEKNRKLRVAA
jgi:hypothetical protein